MPSDEQHRLLRCRVFRLTALAIGGERNMSRVLGYFCTVGFVRESLDQVFQQGGEATDDQEEHN